MGKQQTSINIQPIKSTSEEHNLRQKKLHYVNPELSEKNKSFVASSVSDRLAIIQENYKNSVGQKMQKKATPIREGVVVLDESTTMEDLKNLATKLQQKFGIKTFQIHIHDDEGHQDKLGKWKKNRHAHMVFDWTQKSGKSLKLNKDDMSEIQTITAEVLKMKRGESSNKRHLSAVQFKVEAEKKQLKELKKSVNVRSTISKFTGFDRKKIEQLEQELQEKEKKIQSFETEMSKLSDLRAFYEKAVPFIEKLKESQKKTLSEREKLKERVMMFEKNIYSAFILNDEKAKKLLVNFADSQKVIKYPSENEQILTQKNSQKRGKKV